MSKIAESVEKIAAPIVEAQGCELVDVEYVKKPGGAELVVYIDREGGIDLDICEAVSRALDGPLDEADPVPGPYYLCVSSPGIDRPLKTDAELQKNIGGKVDVSLFAKRGGKKLFIGALTAFDAENVTLDGKTALERKNIALIRPHIEF